MESIRKLRSRIVENVRRVLVGRDKPVELVLIALLAQGHVLIEDVPGVGKTTLVRALAKSVGCEFRRIQFTPDLLPSDVTGVSVYDQRTGSFQFRPGPIMANIVLADEINRTSPKTQASLLECMQERQVTVDGITYPLPEPFMVLATQNPVEYEGTFPLPEAQLDRFMLQVSLGYPNLVEEAEMLTRFSAADPLEELQPVATAQDILEAQQAVRRVRANRAVREYVARVVHSTRHHPQVHLGASPRATLALFRACQALAASRGRSYIIPDDVKFLAPAVLAHRLLLRPEARLEEATGHSVIQSVLNQVPVPVGDVNDTPGGP